MLAGIHPREEDRLAVLHDKNILDTESDAEFDELVEFAGDLCGTEIALISLVEDTRQWFKSERGLGVCETPIEQSICSHAILSDGFFEIPDTTKDPRTADNPLCMGDDPLRYYAGVPLVGKEGLPLGTLCVLDRAPKTMNSLQRKGLTVLARQVMRLIDLQRSVEEAAILRQEVDHRVKNSLQSVAAMTRIQRRRAKSDEARDILEMVEMRIMTVASLHELIYKTTAGDRISLQALLHAVSHHLENSLHASLGANIDVMEVAVSSAVASGLATVVNEFVTNAIKHAFTDGGGEIQIMGKITSPEEYEFTCADNGPGLPPESVRGDGLGLRIMEAAAAQIGATLDLSSDASGTRITMTIPLTV